MLCLHLEYLIGSDPAVVDTCHVGSVEGADHASHRLTVIMIEAVVTHVVVVARRFGLLPQ